MEKSQVKYLPTKHFPSFSEQERLYELQAEHRHFYWMLFKECKTKYQVQLRKQQMQNRLRETCHIVSNQE
jgi:hypothetical protein